MGFFQKIWTFGWKPYDRIDKYDNAKLCNPDRVMNFLREMKELLEIKDAVPYVFGGTFHTGQPHEQKYINGCIVGSLVSVLIETWPETCNSTKLLIKVFHDNISQEILDQVGTAAERIFGNS